ncbi:MAG: hypothetical protein KC983_01130 [Phycisphaerales bacterium]|nr:hypothetical protein [Phycisphaerales bacterium]
MDDIRALLRLAAQRINTTRFLRYAHVTAIVFASIAFVLMLFNRTTAEPFVPWMWVIPSMMVLTLAIAGIFWMRSRMPERSVALAVDDRLELNERLSTALAVERQDDPFARAAVQDAVQAAVDPRNRERTRRLFAVRPPAGWWWSPLIVLATCVSQWLPQMNLYEPTAVVPAAAEGRLIRAEVEERVEDVMAVIEENEALKQALGEDFSGMSVPTTKDDPMRSPEEIRRNALKKVTDLNRKLNDIVEGEKGKAMDAIEQSLKSLELPERDSPARDMAESLARADFAKAAEAMKEMLDKIKNGEMTQDEQDKLAEQLQDVAEQLQQMAEKQQQLKDALKQAGLNEQLANDPAALQQAIQNNPNLNEQQKQQLQQQAQAGQQAQQMLEGLGQACQQMGQNMQQGMGDQLGQAGQQMGQQLGNMEQLEQMLKQAQAAMNECQGGAQQLGQGLGMGNPGQQGDGQGQGQGQAMQPGMQAGAQGGQGGMGQQGQGSGGKAPVAPTPTRTVIKKANVETDPTGDVIAKQFFWTEDVERGESRAAVADVVLGKVEGYDEALSEAQIPKVYEETHKHYFGEVKKILNNASKPKAGDSAEKP